MALHLLVWLANEPTAAVLWLARLLTYSLHAALWTAVAALLLRRKSLSASTRHSVCKLAIFAPFVSTLCAFALPGPAEPAADEPRYLREISVLSLGSPADTEPHRREPSSGFLATSAAAAVALGGALGLVRFAASALLLSRRLRGRTAVGDARLLQSLERIRARTNIRRVVLTEGANINSPMVLGEFEICLPRGALALLADPEIDCVLSHELAHLERRDGLWFPLVGLVQAVLWLQPTNHWLGARFRQTAELACDDRAVDLTGDPRGLARALTQLAAGALLARQGVLAPAISNSPGMLLDRVGRLAAAARHPEFRPKARRRFWALASLLAGGLATTALSFRIAQADPPAPDPEAASKRLAELTRREQQLEAQIAGASSRSGAPQSSAAASVQLIELEQELRHVRATEAWLEQRFVAEWTAWEQRPKPHPRAAK